jgi:cell division transport system permease protein
LLISININSWIGDLRSKLELEVFLDRAITEKETENALNKAKLIKGVQTVRYISKEEAAKRFEQEFGRNVYEILNSNPLPASMVILLQPLFQNAAGAASVTSELNKIEGVEEVIYQKELIALIDNYLNIIYISGITIVIFLITITFILLYNTIRITIFARKDIIEIMKLVGAKKSFIKRPFVIEGLLQGILGSAIAAAATHFTAKIIIKSIYPYLVVKNEIYLIIILSGILIGFLSSRISVNKHLDINVS